MVCTHILAQLWSFFAHRQLSAVSNMFQHQTPDQTSAAPVARVTSYVYGVVLFPLFDQPDNMVAGTNNNHQNLGKVLTFG